MKIKFYSYLFNKKTRRKRGKEGRKKKEVRGRKDRERARLQNMKNKKEYFTPVYLRGIGWLFLINIWDYLD